MARFEYGWNSRENMGIGGYRLPPPYAQTGYNSTGNNANLMLTETWIATPRIVNETRFQYTRNYSSQIGNLLPQVSVSGAFTSGGANEGVNYDTRQHFELQNNTSILHGAHTFRYGMRTRRESDRSQSPNGFGGVFAFDGGSAPVLDANNNIVTDSSGNPVLTTLSAVAQYTRTLMLQKAGFTPTQIRQLGGGASQFNIDAGNPYSSISQYDVGLFAQDDWRLRPTSPSATACAMNGRTTSRTTAISRRAWASPGRPAMPKTAARRPSSAVASVCSTTGSMKA